MEKVISFVWHAVFRILQVLGLITLGPLAILLFLPSIILLQIIYLYCSLLLYVDRRGIIIKVWEDAWRSDDKD